MDSAFCRQHHTVVLLRFSEPRSGSRSEIGLATPSSVSSPWTKLWLSESGWPKLCQGRTDWRKHEWGMLMKCAVLFSLFSAAVAVGQVAKIVGGEDAGTDEFPFVAKIIYGGSQVGCTGSLIAENKVLTAAHCLDNYTAASISVAFGNSRNSGGFHQAVSIEKHPLYIGDHANEYDFAIIEFSPTVRNIEPVRILNEQAELQWVPEVAYGVIVGWGGTTAANNPPLPNTLKKLAVPIRREESCLDMLLRLRREGKDPQNPAITYKVLCAGEEGRAAAQGDSGGPLLVLTTDGWAQVGVLSQSTRNPFGSSERIVYFNTFFRTALEYEWIYPRPTLTVCTSHGLPVERGGKPI